MLEEVNIGRAIADAAKEAGVVHFIFAGLTDADKYSNGKYVRP